MEKEKLESYWNWIFKNKWFYIIFVVWFIINNTLWNFANGVDSWGVFLGNIISLLIILIVLFSIAYYIYRAGYRKACKNHKNKVI